MEKQKITIITGGCGGIGKSVVKKFLENGDIVIVFDIKKMEDESILKHQNFIYMNVDVVNTKAVQEAKEKIDTQFGYVDNIISMAGINTKSEIGGMDTITIDDIDSSVKLNLNSHIYMVKIFLDLLKKSTNTKKTITFISSINAIRDYGLPAYSAAKSGLYGFMKAIVNPMGKQNIRVNIVSFGTVPHDGENIEGVKYYENMIKTIPSQKFVTPKDAADTLYSLTYITTAITGQNIILDQGQST